MTATTTEAPAPTAPGLGDRLRRTDPLSLLCGLTALVVYLLRGFGGPLTRDLGVYSYGGQQVAEGVAPYVAILNRAGPLAHLVPGIGAWVARRVGVDDVVGMRALLMLVAVAAVVTVYLLARDLFHSRAAGLACAAALLASEGFTRNATFGPREKTTMVLFFALALLAMVHQRWGTSGAMIALGTMSWQPVAFPAIAGVAVAALLGARTGRITALVRIAVGGLIPTAITVAAYAAIGQLQVFIDDFYLINARYTNQDGFLTRPQKMWDNMAWAYGWSVWVFYAGFLVVLALAVHAAARRSRSEPQGGSLVGLGVAAVVCVLWSMTAFNSWADAYVLLPLVAVGIGGAAHVLRSWLTARAVAAVAVAWALVATGMSAAYSLSTRSTALDGQRAEAIGVMSFLPKDARIVCIEAPQPLVFLDRRNPTRLQLFGHGLVDYVDDTWPGGIVGYGRWIGRQAPTVLAVGDRGRPPRWIRPVIEESYASVGQSDGPYRWFINTRVPQATRDKIKAMLHEQ